MKFILPYPGNMEVAYCAYLIRRDIRGLMNRAKKNIKGKAEKLKGVFKKPKDDNAVEFVEFEDTHYNPEDVPAVSDPTPTPTPKPISIFASRIISKITSKAKTTDDDHSSCPSTGYQDPQQPKPDTLYEFLKDKSDHWYYKRPTKGFDSHHEGFLKRGIKVFMDLMLLACPSNTAYDVLRDRRAFPDESQLLELFELAADEDDEDKGKGKRKRKGKRKGKGKSKGKPIAGLPAVHGNDRQQINLLLSVIRRTAGLAGGGDVAGFPPPSILWYAFLVASVDCSATMAIMEALLDLACPGVDAQSMILRAGNVNNLLRGHERDEWRWRFRRIFFPEYDAPF
ncbi:hypothetical protein BS50DRAFT_232555 [Corynespora cassiicola Philippines]|uniref:Uncharacterized protein n=1 Tax=Corynespora cassiicola Philippines TaxID=1448308 RepID=A0A2T2P1U7_CORCC|nr:hypothetical protein BS50DRAFT_232555 [Corynespora cassiicola Philippines]